MNLEINIAHDILSQFAEQLKIKAQSKSLDLTVDIGKGEIRQYDFPNTLELFHFTFKLKKALKLNSFNPIDSEYLLLNINLSEQSINKRVNGEQLDIQKYLPSGILYYPPNIKVSSISPTDSSFEIVLIRFHKNLLTTYFEEKSTNAIEIKDTIIYEDLDYTSEELIKKVLAGSNKMKSHAYLLTFLSIFFDKIESRATRIKYENLHPQDIKQLFLTAAALRNPKAQNIPSIDDLARAAGMGKTKFKNIFKQVFGNAPRQYHQKIKMEYAKEELQKNNKTSTEIAYELGYAHPSKFTRAFKNHFGDAPSAVL